MRMLLASSDLPALQPLTTRLVSAGIPIALCKESDISSCLEVWIQRDSDFFSARRILAEVVGLLGARQAPAEDQAASGRKEENGSQESAEGATFGGWASGSLAGPGQAIIA